MKKSGLGRGKGWNYEYPEGSARFAAGIAQELPRCHRLHLAALSCFASGISPATKDVLVRLLAPPDLASMLGPDPHRTATRMANKASRRASRSPLIREVKTDLDHPGDLAGFLRGSFDFVFTGEDASLKNALQILKVSPSTSEEMGQAIEGEFGNLGDVPKHLQTITAAMEEASLADFEQARDDALAANQGIREIVGALANITGATLKDDSEGWKVDAMSLVPVFLVGRNQLGDQQITELLSVFEDPMQYFERVADALRAWSDERPDDAALLRPLALAVLQRSLS